SALKQNRSCWLFAGFWPGRQKVPLGQSRSCSHRWGQTQYGAFTRHSQTFGFSQLPSTEYTEHASPNWERSVPQAPMTASTSAAPSDSRGIRTLRFMLSRMLAQERGPGRGAEHTSLTRMRVGVFMPRPSSYPSGETQ